MLTVVDFVVDVTKSTLVNLYRRVLPEDAVNLKLFSKKGVVGRLLHRIADGTLNIEGCSFLQTVLPCRPFAISITLLRLTPPHAARSPI